MAYERLEWTPEEEQALADAFVAGRLKDFTGSMREVWKPIWGAVLQPGRRKARMESNPAWTILPRSLRAKIVETWRVKTGTVAPMEAAETAEPPPPIFIRVVEQAPADLHEALRTADTTFLVAQVAQRFIEQSARTNDLLAQIVTRLGAIATVKPEPKAAAAATPPQPLQRKPKRVAIVGPLDSQIADIERAVQENELFVDCRYIDKKQMEHAADYPPSVDFAIITKHTRHGWYENARKIMGNGNVFFVDGPVTSVVQKLRDIASMK